MGMLWEKFQRIYLSIWNQLVFNQRLPLFVQSPQPYIMIFAWRKSMCFSNILVEKNEYLQNNSQGIEMLISFLCWLLPEILLNDAASTYCERSQWGTWVNTQALSAPISSLSLLLVQTQAAIWRAAVPEQLTCAHLYPDIAKPGYFFHGYSSGMTYS